MQLLSRMAHSKQVVKGTLPLKATYPSLTFDLTFPQRVNSPKISRMVVSFGIARDTIGKMSFNLTLCTTRANPRAVVPNKTDAIAVPRELTS